MANLFRADFYGWRAVSGLTTVTVRQKFGNHSLFWLDYQTTNNQKYLLPPEGTPFSIRVGAGPLGARTLYGYVNHAEAVDTSDSSITRLVGLGTSKVMNTTRPTSWDGSSRTGIIRDIGRRYRLRTIIHNHPEVLEAWATGSMTDFRAINTLANEIGYRLWVDGPNLWLLDPQQVLATASAASTKIVRAGQQRSAQVFSGSNVPGQVSASKRTVQYGFDRTTNEVLETTSGDYGLPVEMLTDPVDSLTGAKYASDSAQKNAQDQSALDVTIDGDIAISPGTPIRFDSSVTNPEQQGLWLVNDATHQISGTGFTTRVLGTRDKSRTPMSRVPDVVRREGANAAAVVRNGSTWEAVVQESVSA